tara:strand:- start:325 stop:1467 length:1143 start_codon:yes stop_codon:yes gene_type:complete
MKRRFKLKVNGECPRSLLLAYFLAKLKSDVYICNISKISNIENDHQIFLFSNFLKNILVKYDIWNEFEDISYGFNSLSIKDNLVSEQLLIRPENLSKNYLNNIGWTAIYSDIKRLLINQLLCLDNVHFILKNQLIDKTLKFDYEFNFNNNNFFNSYKFPLSLLKRKDKQILIFKVSLRGNVEKRFYEINTSDGLLILTPLNKNLYQIIWNNSSNQITERALSSKSFFLDNLTNLIPSELKIDQIIGEIKFFGVSDISPICLTNKNSIYFNENKFKSNSLYDLYFESFIRNILQLCNLLENNKFKNIKILNKLGFNYLLKKYFEFLINFSFYTSLFNIFTLNNRCLLFIRKLFFITFKKVNFFKTFFLRLLTISNINNLIK